MSRRRISTARLKGWLRDDVELADLLRLSADDLEWLAWQGTRRLDAGQVDDASRIFELLSWLRPRSDAFARLGRGVCHQARGDLDQAGKAYDEVLAADPANIHALTNRAEVRLLTDHPDAARIDLRAAQAILERDGGPAALRERVKTLRNRATEALNAPGETKG